MRCLSRVVTLATVIACAAPGTAGELGLLTAPEPLAAALRARFGTTARILSLSLGADDARIEVQDPANPMHVDRYAFEEGALGAPEPVQVGRSQRVLNARLFALADVDLSVVPRLLADARERARTEDAQATQVSIERVEGTGDYSSWSRPLILVTVNGPRGGAVVEYGLDGKHKRVTRW